MSRRSGLALAAGVIAFAAITTLVGIASGAPLDFLVLDLVTGLTFVVAGIAAVWLRPGSPAGPMLLVSGGLWYVGSYGPSGQPVVTNLGFAFEGYYDLVLAALLLVLSSPAQRRPTAMARRGARRGDGHAVARPAAPARLSPTVGQTRLRSGRTWRRSRRWRSRPASRCPGSSCSSGSWPCGGSFAPVPSGGASAGRSSSPAVWRWGSLPSMPSRTRGRSPRSSPSSPCPSRGTRCSRGRCSGSGPSCRSPS